jgi:hypothetical protein
LTIFWVFFVVVVVVGFETSFVCCCTFECPILQESVRSLEKLAERLEFTMSTSSPVTAMRLYVSYLDSVQLTQDIVDILKQQMQAYAKQPNLPNIQSLVSH